MNKTKTIGIFHYQVGCTDGVSLEIEKWQCILEELGHTVHLCAGDLGDVDGTLIEEMYHHIPEIKRLNYNTFKELRDFDEESYKAELDRWTELLVARFRDFFRQKQIDFIIPQNVWCVAASPPVAIALEQVRREFNIPALAHHHDFYWERTGGLALTCGPAIELADKYLPPRAPNIQHVVINSLSQTQLEERKGLPSTVVPNIFDFDAPPWVVDEYNRDFRTQIGLNENDILILQATRVVPRKGIELAIDFVNALNAPSRRTILYERGLYDGRPFTEDSRIVLVLAGYTMDDTTGRYMSKLQYKARLQDVDMIHIADIVGIERLIKNQQNIYSLWDTYVFADFVTYPSLWEGWGNQFLEAIRARLPILVFEYPVYQSDIKQYGFQVVSLGSEITGLDENGLAEITPEVINAAADKAIGLLTDQKQRQAAVENNFLIGKKNFSMDTLRSDLSKLVADYPI